jgi:hypothetical protein
MRMRYVWLVVLVVVFLAGYAPPALKNAKLEAELQTAKGQLDDARLRDEIAFTYIQAAQKNYGMAAQSSTRFFNAVQQAAGKSENAPRKQALDQIFGYRDKVTAALAKGDPGVLNDLQDLVLKTRSATTAS